MDPFSRKSRQTRRRRPDTVVLCAFRELTNPEPLRNFDPEHAYAYRWALPTLPAIGQWAMVEGYDDPSIIIVGAIGMNSYVEEFGVDSLDSITYLVPTADIQRARAAVEKKLADQRVGEAVWLAYCRWVAGIDACEPTNLLPSSMIELYEEVLDANARTGSKTWRSRTRSDSGAQGSQPT